MSSSPSSSPFDDLLRELDELPSASPAAPPRDENKELAMQKLLDASKLLETVAASLDPSDPKHPLHGVTLPEEAKRRLQAIVQRLVVVQQQLNEIEGEILGESPTQDTPSSTPPGPSAAFLAAKVQLEEERKTFDAYKQQWEAVFAADPSQREVHPEVIAYYKQMEQYFVDHESYIKTL